MRRWKQQRGEHRWGIYLVVELKLRDIGFRTNAALNEKRNQSKREVKWEDLQLVAEFDV